MSVKHITGIASATLGSWQSFLPLPPTPIGVHARFCLSHQGCAGVSKIPPKVEIFDTTAGRRPFWSWRFGNKNDSKFGSLIKVAFSIISPSLRVRHIYSMIQLQWSNHHKDQHLHHIVPEQRIAVNGTQSSTQSYNIQSSSTQPSIQSSTQSSILSTHPRSGQY